MPPAVGLDFGTTNTALAVADPDGDTRLARFDSAEGATPAFRSLLHVGLGEGGSRRVSAGPEAIRAYLDGDAEGRLIQSLKSYLASRSFTSTVIFGRSYSLEDLVGHLLGRVREAAEASLGPLGDRAVVGRPIRYVDSSGPEDDEHALERMRRALAKAGFTQVVFEPEPLAAAWEYRRRLERDALTLIADFGGGTTDFSLLRLRRQGRAEVLGTAGVGLAGDAFDARLVEHVVSGPLGRGSRYRTTLGKELELPKWIFARLERWHHVSFLKSPDTLGFLRAVQARSEAPERVAALLHVVEEDLGYRLHGAVHRCKVGLTADDRATLHFTEPPASIREEVERARFEEWIAPELAAIEGCCRTLLETAGVPAREVDTVFLTGGSSFVPAVRRLFADRFGEEKLRGGEELTSVGRGLALRALENPWEDPP
jgi:hypothetical chaperone protein